MLDLKILTLENNQLVPTMRDTSVYVSGLPLLIQRIVKCLLTEPGQDRFNPEFGAGIQVALPRLYNPSQLESSRMAATEAIIKTEKQIKEEDADSTSTPDERLSSLYLRDISFDINRGAWIVELTLKSMDMKVASFKVGT